MGGEQNDRSSTQNKYHNINELYRIYMLAVKFYPSEIHSTRSIRRTIIQQIITNNNFLDQEM